MEIPVDWRLQKQRRRLEGRRCPDGHLIFPPRDICPHRVEKPKPKPDQTQIAYIGIGMYTGNTREILFPVSVPAREEFPPPAADEFRSLAVSLLYN